MTSANLYSSLLASQTLEEGQRLIIKIILYHCHLDMKMAQEFGQSNQLYFNHEEALHETLHSSENLSEVRDNLIRQRSTQESTAKFDYYVGFLDALDTALKLRLHP